MLVELRCTSSICSATSYELLWQNHHMWYPRQPDQLNTQWRRGLSKDTAHNSMPAAELTNDILIGSLHTVSLEMLEGLLFFLFFSSPFPCLFLQQLHICLGTFSVQSPQGMSKSVIWRSSRPSTKALAVEDRENEIVGDREQTLKQTRLPYHHHSVLDAISAVSWVFIHRLFPQRERQLFIQSLFLFTSHSLHLPQPNLCLASGRLSRKRRTSSRKRTETATDEGVECRIRGNHRNHGNDKTPGIRCELGKSKPLRDTGQNTPKCCVL